MSTEQLETGNETEAGPRAQDDQAQVEAIQAELDALRRQVAEREAPRHRGRMWAVALLIVLGSLLAFGGDAALWVRNVIWNTDTWVRTVGPLSQDEVVVSAVSGLVVQEVYKRVDVEATALEVLPEEVAFLSGPLSRALRDVLADVIGRVVESEQFNAIWRELNRVGHRALIKVLGGEGELVYLRNGQLTLDLSGVLSMAERALGLSGAASLLGVELDPEAGMFVLLESDQVAVLQRVLGTLNAVGILLPLLALAAYVGAWLVSLWRRKTLQWIGIALAISMGLMLLLLWLLQPIALASLTEPTVRAVAGAIWGVVTRGLIVQTVVVGVVGLLLALGAWLAGPHRWAVSARAWFSGLFRKEDAPAEA